MNAPDPARFPINDDDGLTIYDTRLVSRLLLGTSQYPSPAILHAAVAASATGVVTVSLRREAARQQTGQRFFEMIADWDVRILPNTAGCRTVKDAVTTAQMAREVFDTRWVKLEVIANDDTLQPDVFALVEAAGELVRQGFQVFPYTTEDLGVAERLMAAGCEVLMPWGAPIGTGRGLANPYALTTMRNYFKGVPLIVDAGIGAPSHAAQAMEMGYDGILLNTAISKAADPAGMAAAFADAVSAGRRAWRSGLMEQREMAAPSTPVAGTPFFDLGGA